MVEYHLVSAVMITTASNSITLSHLWIVAYFALHQNTITFERLPLDLESFAVLRYLFVTQCCHPILGGRGRAISILIRNHLEHILLIRKRISKGMKRMTSLPLSPELSPVVIS